MDNAYVAPSIVELGTVAELTLASNSGPINDSQAPGRPAGSLGTLS